MAEQVTTLEEEFGIRFGEVDKYLAIFKNGRLLGTIESSRLGFIPRCMDKSFGLIKNLRVAVILVVVTALGE